MYIKEALAPTGEAKTAEFSSLYVRVNEKGLLCWFDINLNAEATPVALLHILKNDWHPVTRLSYSPGDARVRGL